MGRSMARPRPFAVVCIWAAALPPGFAVAADAPVPADVFPPEGAAPLRLSGKHAHCSLEALQVLGPNNYVSVSRGNQTFKSCGEFTGGACPYAVPFPDLPCMINCVAEEADCVEFNKHTPGVNPFVDPYLCAPCSITACKACEYPEDMGGKPICRQCFVGFKGSQGKDGRWEACDLWDAAAVSIIAMCFAAFVSFLTLLLLVTTTVGACRLCGKKKRKETVESSDDAAAPLLSLDDHHANKEAIRKGLEFSVMSSIKFTSMRRLIRKFRGGRMAICRLIGRALLDSDTDLSDMGIGLFLFFNTQKFLIVVAFITWMVSRGQETPSQDYQTLEWALESAQCPATPMDVIGSLVQQSPRIEYADSYRLASFFLWLILLFLSWGFYCYQQLFVTKYDRTHQTAEDYTLRLQNLPRHVTSERRLLHLLEKEFRMEGKIHGVCICYNMLKLSPDEHAHIEEMIENITEQDTLENGWCTQSTCSPGLDKRIEEDGEDFTQLIRARKIECSGEAYVVFKEQAHMVKVQEERCGIRINAFSNHDDTGVYDDEDMKLNYSMNGTPVGKKGSGESTVHLVGDSMQFVEITPTQSEPSGIRFYEYCTSEEESNWNNNVKMPIRMFCYIGLYSIVAQLFYSSMIRPWQDNMIEGAEGSGAVNLISKLVVLFNFAIQTMVMVDVERFGRFKYLADVDQRTFLWNTLLLVITNMYLIMQECYRPGVRWDITPPPYDQDQEAWWEWRRTWFQSTKVEGQVAERLAELMTEQIMMLYIIGEVANVLAPVIFYWIALRGIFVWNLGGDNSRVQQVLRSMLPEHENAEKRVTARLAERAQILVPLLLWMEYTYIVVFAWMAFFTFFLASGTGSTVCGLLFGFSVIFYIWQRYVMLWLYGKATYDTEASYVAFSRVWGFVISFLPPISVWWTYRLGGIQEKTFAFVVMAMIFALATLVYQYGLWCIDWLIGSRFESVDTFEGGKDPGYTQVMESQSYSWWNTNPIYVLKTRHCPEEPDFEVHDAATQERLWPKNQKRKGFFELGKEFRHEEKHLWDENNALSPSARQDQGLSMG